MDDTAFQDLDGDLSVPSGEENAYSRLSDNLSWEEITMLSLVIAVSNIFSDTKPPIDLKIDKYNNNKYMYYLDR